MRKLILLLLFLPLFSFSQNDTIVFLNGERRIVNILKVDANEVTFKYLNEENQNSIKSKSLSKNSPAGNIFCTSYQELLKVGRFDDNGKKYSVTSNSTIDHIEHVIHKSSAKEFAKLESFVPFLATVGSSAPYIGLFGTVLGIIKSFQDIGTSGSASLATVAPGLAEALVATAVGLIAAIPATIAYNYFSVQIKKNCLELEHFAQDMLSVIKRYIIQ